MYFSAKIGRNVQTATLLIVVSSLAAGFEHGNIVKTTNGRVRGVRETTQRKQVDFVAFRGIPYAKPPLGELRLKVNFLGSLSIRRGYLKGKGLP